MSRVEYWNDAHAPTPNSLVPACGALAVDDRGRVLLQRRRDTGQWAAVNDEASDVRWVVPADLWELDIHPTQWRQLNHYLNATYPHVD